MSNVDFANINKKITFVFSRFNYKNNFYTMEQSQSLSQTAKHNLPMQFASVDGGVSWVGVGLLLLTTTALFLQIRAHYINIQKHKNDEGDIAELKKELFSVKKRVGMI